MVMPSSVQFFILDILLFLLKFCCVFLFFFVLFFIVLREHLTERELDFLNLPVSSLHHSVNRDRLSMTTDELLAVPHDGSMPVTHTSAFLQGPRTHHSFLYHLPSSPNVSFGNYCFSCNSDIGFMSQFLWLPLFTDPGLLSHSEASQLCSSSRPAHRNRDRLSSSNSIVPQLTHHHPQPARHPTSSRFIWLSNSIVYAKDPKPVVYIITFSTLPGAEKNQGQPR